MPPKKNGNDGTRKSSTLAAEPKPPKPMESEIAVQDPSKPSKQEHAGPEASCASEKNFHNIDHDPPPPAETPLQEAQDLICLSLKKLQVIYNDALKAKAEKITIELPTFTSIGNMLQEAWEHTRTAQREEGKILNAFRQIQASIADLEQKHEDIQAIVMENNTEIALKLNEIQATTARLETKHETIERTIKEAPKTYTDITKTTIINTKENLITETHARHRQHPDTLRQERAKYEVTLTMKETNDEVKELINTMPPKEITERCQHAIEKASISDIKLQGINRLANGIRIRCATEEQAEQLRVIDWDEAFKGIKIHEPKYGIVINGVPTDDLDPDDPKTIKSLETINNLPSGTISKVTFLRRKDKEPSIKMKHRSIVIYFKNNHTANKCIRNGCYINYLHYQPQRFVPQFQIMQCFNCCEYGHRAANCKRKTRCGKCAGTHNTKECNNTKVQCVNCKDSHEAWRHECLAWTAEKHRLEELRDHCPKFFTN
jgi:hypothetical protein